MFRFEYALVVGFILLFLCCTAHFASMLISKAINHQRNMRLLRCFIMLMQSSSLFFARSFRFRGSLFVVRLPAVNVKHKSS